MPSPAVARVGWAASKAGFSMSTMVDLGHGAGMVPAVAAAVAVAMGESGGNPSLIHHNGKGSLDYGAWQINSVHLDSLKVTGQALLDIDTNAAAAFRISNGGTDWSPWVAYKNGRAARWYKANIHSKPGDDAYWLDLGVAKKGGGFGLDDLGNIITHPGDVIDAGKSVLEAANPVGALTSALGSFVTIVGKFFGAILDVGWWKRVGIGLAGLVAIAVGLGLTVGDSFLPGPVKAIAEVAGKVAA